MKALCSKIPLESLTFNVDFYFVTHLELERSLEKDFEPRKKSLIVAKEKDRRHKGGQADFPWGF